MSDKAPNQFDGELAALRHHREMESLHASPCIEAVVNAAASLADKIGIPIGGLFRTAFKNGQTPVETLIEQLEAAAWAEISRINEHLEGQDVRLGEFAERLKSAEAQFAYQSVVFHGLRTSDPGKQSRLGTLTINCVYTNDLKPESLDDMMRAAVELTDWDIFVLGKMYESQKHLLPNPRGSADWSEQVGHVWTNWGRIFALGEDQHARLRSALSRLQSLGLIAEAQTHFVKDGSLATQAFGLLLEGKKFHERLREIGATK